MKELFLAVCCFLSNADMPLQGVTVSGRVADAATQAPLPYASVSLKGTSRGTSTSEDGTFRLRLPSLTDTLLVSYIGYSAVEIPLKAWIPDQTIFLRESFTLLNPVSIRSSVMNIKATEKQLRVIRENLYAMETEVTNQQFNLFLRALEERGSELVSECRHDLSRYSPSAARFFRQYAYAHEAGEGAPDTVQRPHIGPRQWGDYPVVNISHRAALEYCRWLTAEYNAYRGRKRFRQVIFRLPSLKEWQIAALGYSGFTSWNILDNTVPVVVSPDSLNMVPRKGTHKSIEVSDVLYPWYGSYYYRRSPHNHKGCFLANFRIDYVEHPCPASNPAYDGWSMMGRTASYFPNNIGLYDVVGNVAEMIDEPGKACGGSWDDEPAQSTIHSIKTYPHANATVGFRVFMEVIQN